MKSLRDSLKRWWVVLPIAAFVALGSWTLRAGTVAEREGVEEFLRSDASISRYFGRVSALSKQPGPGKVVWFGEGKKEGQFTYKITGTKKEDVVVIYWRTEEKLIIDRVITYSTFSSSAIIYERSVH